MHATYLKSQQKNKGLTKSACFDFLKNKYVVMVVSGYKMYKVTV